MPDLSEAAGYLVALLHSAGIAQANGMGLTGLSWQEIEAWARCNDLVSLESCGCSTQSGGMRKLKKRKPSKRGIVGPKELRAVWQLSRAYVAEHSEASKKGAKAPYIKVDEDGTRDEVERKTIAQKAEDIFGIMLSAQSKK